MPVAEGNFAVMASACNTHRPALLLCPADFVGKGFGSAHVVYLRRRLVVPRTPGFTSVHRHQCAWVVPTFRHKRRGWLGEIATLICARSSGTPLLNFRHVWPPSVDLNRPPSVPPNSLLSSHGPRRHCHNDA